jgi:putative transposase
MKSRINFPVLALQEYGVVMKRLSSALGFSESEISHLRLRCIELLEKHSFAAVRTAYPSVSRATVYRWKRKFDQSGRKLSSLLPHSTRPHKVRRMAIPVAILSFLREVRTQYPRMSKYKLKCLLDIFCEEMNLPMYSASWIGKVINRNRFFFGTRRQIRRKHRTQQKLWVNRCPKSMDTSLGYLQVDGVKVYFDSRLYCFLTGVELVSRQGWARRVKSFNSHEAKEFLLWIQDQIGYKIHTVQTDNGSEFAGVFKEAIEELEAAHLWSRPRSPKSNGFVERFNWTIQDEFLNYHIGEAEVDSSHFDQLLSDWLVFYNTKRPHQGLNYKTPSQYLAVLMEKLPISCLKCP